MYTMARSILDGVTYVSGTLGSGAPGAVNTTIYTAPAKGARDLILRVSNVAAAAKTYRVWNVPSGGAVGTSTNVKFDSTIEANKSLPIVLDDLESGDTVVVYGSDTNVGFILKGKEGR